MSKWTRIATALALTAWVTILGCAQHKDFPMQQTYIPPPAIQNLAITSVGGGKYDLTWSVADPTVVKYYRVYSFNQFGVASPVDTTATPSAGIDLGFELGGVPFGVTSITVENVEGAMAVAVTPQP